MEDVLSFQNRNISFMEKFSIKLILFILNFATCLPRVAYGNETKTTTQTSMTYCGRKGVFKTIYIARIAGDRVRSFQDYLSCWCTFNYTEEIVFFFFFFLCLLNADQITEKINI